MNTGDEIVAENRTDETENKHGRGRSNEGSSSIDHNERRKYYRRPSKSRALSRSRAVIKAEHVPPIS